MPSPAFHVPAMCVHWLSGIDDRESTLLGVAPRSPVTVSLPDTTTRPSFLTAILSRSKPWLVVLSSHTCPAPRECGPRGLTHAYTVASLNPLTMPVELIFTYSGSASNLKARPTLPIT